MLNADICWRAMRARDVRFDGRFFVGVTTTGIYCRPICTARLPRKDRCTFHPSAAAAEKSGFRACFRCRPELAPGGASVDAVPRLVRAAVARINDGALDDRGVDALARELGVTDRHLRRAFDAQLGVSPVELAQTRRLALAKHLLHDTGLSLTTIAFASGFGSVRRFNASMRARFGQAPSQLRRARPRSAPTVLLRLDYRPPLELGPLLEFIAARTIPGVDRVDNGHYIRRIDGEGEVRVSAGANERCLQVEIDDRLALRIPEIMGGLRRLFDLDADPAAIAGVLGDDPLLAPLVRRRPGLRVPGAFDAFETAVRAVLGQQVSVPAATTLMARLVARYERVPKPSELASARPAQLQTLGLPLARAKTLVHLGRAWSKGTIACEPGSDPQLVRAAMINVPGIGPWTAEYLCMRALRDPDAFPASDLGVRKALGGATPREIIRRAEAWRPWRAYAAMHLWTALGRGEL